MAADLRKCCSEDERLERRIEHLAKTDDKYSKTQCLKVKITGDDTSISCSIHLVVIAFTLVENEPQPNSPKGNHVIALINTTEDYENLLEALDDITSEVKNLNSVVVNGVSHNVEFFWGLT